MKVTDSEVIGVMKDGGRQLCEYAREQWYSGKYGNDQKMKQENLKRWREIENRIPELARLLKEVVQDG